MKASELINIGSNKLKTNSIKSFILEFLIPLPLAIKDIPSKILVLPQPFLPKKIFSLSSKKRFKLLKFLKVVKLIFFITPFEFNA